MLEILNVEDLNDKTLNIVRYRTKKKQIMLYDTSRKLNDYFNMLRYRMNGKNENIPHFVVSKRGEIFQLFDTRFYSRTFKDKDLDKKQVKIAVENLGWLSKNTINGFLHNWIDTPFRTTPYIKKWRGYFYWDFYSEEQMNAIQKLIPHICEEENIPNISISSNYYFENAPKFNGILYKSNFSDIYTDINPSFEFKKIVQDEKNIKRI